MKNLFIKGIPAEIAKALKVAAASREMKIGEIVIAALQSYLAYLAAEGIDNDRH